MPDIDYTAWRFWIDIAQMGFTLLIGVYVWLANRKKAVDKRFAQIEATFEARCNRRQKQISDLENEHAVMRVQISHMPSQADIKELSGKLESVQIGMSKLDGRLEGINRAVDLLNEHHMKESASNEQFRPTQNG